MSNHIDIWIGWCQKSPAPDLFFKDLGLVQHSVFVVQNCSKSVENSWLFFPAILVFQGLVVEDIIIFYFDDTLSLRDSMYQSNEFEN